MSAVVDTLLLLAAVTLAWAALTGAGIALTAAGITAGVVHAHRTIRRAIRLHHHLREA